MIKVRVDQAECFRRGINHTYPETVELDIDPGQLPQEERNWIADHLKNNEFSPPTFDFKGICPPSVEGFLEAVRAFMSESSGESDSVEAV